MEQLELFNKDDLQNNTQKRQKENDFAKNYQAIVLTSSVKQDQYTDFIGEKFDLHISDTSEVIVPNKLNINTLNDWNIGVICGASGSGKSTILRHLAKQNGVTITKPSFDNSKCLISNFTHMTPNDATILLSAMGLASVPTWIRPFNVLSNGEQYRASLAMLVSKAKEDEIIFVDEYTSVVDRNVAMAMSNALQKYVRRNNKKIVLATCHYDIFEWLRPDWIYDLNKGGALEKGEYLRRPQIELQVYRTTSNTWERFKKYHYMTAQLNEASTCFVFTWNEKMVAFVGVLPFPNGSLKNAYRETRTVVLPDYQGLGIGSKITDFIGGIYKNEGKLYFTKTINPALGLYREKSPKWAASSTNGKERSEKEVSKEHNMMGGLTRPSYCYKYVGEPISGFEDLLLPIDKIRYQNSMKGQLSLF